MNIRVSQHLFLVLCASSVLTAPALAQDSVVPRRGDTVLNRQRPATDATGLPLSGGALRLFPTLDVGALYDSNIYAQSQTKVSDIVTLVQPQLLMTTAGPAPAVQVRAFGDFQYHADETSEDAEDYGAEVTGQTSRNRPLQFEATTGFARQTRDRSDPEEVSTNPRSELNRYFGRGKVGLQLQQMRISVSGEMRRLDFVQAINDDRDRKELIVRGEVSLLRNADREIYLAPEWRDIDYDDEVDRAGFDRDRSDLSGYAGIRLGLGGLISGTAEVGATNITYDDPTFDDHLLATAMVDVDWNVTRLTTVNITAERAPQATTQPGSSVRIDNSLELSVTHELRRSLLVELEAGYANWNFKGIDRSDDVMNAGVGVTYLMNRYVNLVAEYQYYDRSSEFDLADFSRHRASIGLKLQL
jgi:hypothetical protein